MNSQPIVVKQEYNVPAAKLWQVLTDVDEMRNWYFDLQEFKGEIGFKFQFTAGTEDGGAIPSPL